VTASSPPRARVEQVLGPAMPALPWATEAGARLHLSPRAERRFQSAIEQMDEAWLLERPWGAVLDAMTWTIPGTTALAWSGPLDGVPFWAIFSDAGEHHEGPPRWLDRSAASTLRRYDADPSHPLANRPASLSTLTLSEPSIDASLEVFENIWVGTAGDQLRTFLFGEVAGRTQYLGYYCIARERRGSFTEEDFALLHALQPWLRRWARESAALGLAPFEASGLPVISLDGFAEPAVVVRGRRVVHANAAARCSLGSAMLSSPHEAARSASRFLASDGLEYELLVLPVDRASRAFLALPPSLRQIAELLAEGLSDKEIAERTGRPLDTVRTYVRRVFRKLGVTSRREVMLASRRRP